MESDNLQVEVIRNFENCISFLVTIERIEVRNIGSHALQSREFGDVKEGPIHTIKSRNHNGCCMHRILLRHNIIDDIIPEECRHSATDHVSHKVLEEAVVEVHPLVFVHILTEIVRNTIIWEGNRDDDSGEVVDMTISITKIFKYAGKDILKDRNVVPLEGHSAVELMLLEVIHQTDGNESGIEIGTGEGVGDGELTIQQVGLDVKIHKIYLLSFCTHALMYIVDIYTLIIYRLKIIFIRNKKKRR